MPRNFWRWVGLMRRVEALLHGARQRLTAGRDIAPAKIAGWGVRSKVQTTASAYCAGRIAIDSEFSLAPLIWTTKGCADSSYFTDLRMPAQSVAPLKATGLRTFPS